jgi:hypothetical protein
VDPGACTAPDVKPSVSDRGNSWAGGVGGPNTSVSAVGGVLGTTGVGSGVVTVAGSVAAGTGGGVAAFDGATACLLSTCSTEFEVTFSFVPESEEESLSSMGCVLGDGETQGTSARSSLDRNDGFEGLGALEGLGLLPPLDCAAVAGASEAL